MTRIKVCDALCGSGKTSACIRMMNERTDARFIFVTQFLSEVDRIKSKCKARKFVSPEQDDGHTKLSNIRELLREGRNIATTHALFTNSTLDIKQLVTEQNYVLVLDETVDTLTVSDLRACDMNLLLHHEIVKEDNGRIEWVYDEYEAEDYDGGGKFSKEVLLSKSRNLFKYDDEYYFWAIPPELFACFKEAYVLTYMFNAQLLRCFFDLYGLTYELIGVHKTDGEYEFCDYSDTDRKRDLRNMIHILEHEKLNDVGAKRTDLSFTAYSTSAKRSTELCDKLRKNLVNIFRNVYHAPSKEIMWTTFKDFKDAVASKGFTHSFVPYNQRASNDYADRRYLAYLVNNFMRPWEAQIYSEHGISVNQDQYAVSILIQWIYRSAIRNGEEVWVYIPSARMRSLLKQWLDNLADGRDLEPVVYTASKPVQKRSKRKKEGDEVAKKL